MNKTIKELSDTDLKALAYDNFLQIETSQNNINIINEELNSRKVNETQDVQISQPHTITSTDNKHEDK